MSNIKSKKQFEPKLKQNNRSNKQRSSNKTLNFSKREALIQGGTLIGGMFGQPQIGSMVGAGVSKVLGWGDYRIKSNTLWDAGVPSFGKITSTTRIRHREYVRNYSSSTDFASTSFQVNPGLSELFPWLHQIAANFEEYKIHGMVVVLRSTSAVAVSSTNTALGTIGVVMQYDPTEPAFTSKQECENYAGAMSAPPSETLNFGVECAPQTGVLDFQYIRTIEEVVPEDLKFYDKGKLQIFSQGAQQPSDAGELWITYDIEFRKPRLAKPTAPMAVYNITDVPSAFPLGDGTTSVPERLPGSALDFTIDSDSDTVIFTGKPQGHYLVCWIAAVPSTVAVQAPLMIANGGCVPADLFNNFLNSVNASPFITSNQDRLQTVFTCFYGGGEGSVTVGGPTFTGSANVTLAIIRMPTAMFESITLKKQKANKVKTKLSKLEESKTEEVITRSEFNLLIHMISDLQLTAAQNAGERKESSRIEKIKLPADDKSYFDKIVKGDGPKDSFEDV